MIRGASSRLWSAGAGAAVAVCSYYTGQAVVSVCDSQKVNLLGLSAWLDSRGVDVKGIAFRQTKDMGGGAFATEEIRQRWRSNWVVRAAKRLKLWGSHTLAKFPAYSMINVNTICETDQAFGPLIQEFLSKGMLDESTTLQLFLVLHRSLQQESPYHPYIQSLPTGAELPVNFAQGMLQELAGTEAYDAVHGLQATIASSWVRVQPILDAFREKHKLQPITQEDWTWACSMVLSRSLAVPVADNNIHHTITCLVPGLDLMNHSKHATCWWDVRGDLLSGSGCIEIRCCLWAFPTAGEELCIQYQDSANNTSLLLRYGFVEGHNQDDCVRVFIPWDQTISEGRKIKQRELLARMGCIQAGGDNVSFWLPKEGEVANPVPEPAKKLLHVMNMSEKEVEECLENPGSQKPLSLGDELGIATKFLWLLDQNAATLEGGHTLEDDISILEQGQDSVPPTLWQCVLYRAGHKRIVRGYRKAARVKLDKIIAAMNEQRSV